MKKKKSNTWEMVKRSANDIAFGDYKDVLFNQTVQMRKMNVIRSYKHEIYTETVNKTALSGDDDKRIVLKDRIRTMAYGHFRSEV